MWESKLRRDQGNKRIRMRKGNAYFVETKGQEKNIMLEIQNI